MRIIKTVITCSILIAASLQAFDALGQAKAPAAGGGMTPFSPPRASAPMASRSQESGGYRSFDLTLPVVTLARQAQGRIEYNMGGLATISLEGARMVRGEDLSDEEIEESGDSLQSEAVQGAILFSRYSNGPTMSGFFWSLGAGYRKVNAYWHTNPDTGRTPDENPGRMSLADDKGKLHHDLELAGGTGHGRIGWRWIGESFPMLIGAHIGVRHFDPTIKDAEESRLETETMRMAPTNDVEKRNLKRRMMTALEPGVEIGFAF